MLCKDVQWVSELWRDPHSKKVNSLTDEAYTNNIGKDEMKFSSTPHFSQWLAMDRTRWRQLDLCLIRLLSIMQKGLLRLQQADAISQGENWSRRWTWVRNHYSWWTSTTKHWQIMFYGFYGFYLSVFVIINLNKSCGCKVLPHTIGAQWLHATSNHFCIYNIALLYQRTVVCTCTMYVRKHSI